MFMKQVLLYFIILSSSIASYAQNFELIDPQDNYQTSTSQTVKVPIRIRNNTDKAQFFIIRKVKGDLGETQKGYFCFENNCLEHFIEECSKRVEPGETLQNFYYTLESGLQTGQTNIKLEIFPKGAPAESIEHNFSVSIDEKSFKSSVFQSREITIHDIYPNPVQEQAFIDYKINFASTKAKIVVHNILGKAMADYELVNSENRLKIQSDDLPSGVYFYTVYINDSGILTRKIIVRK